MYQLEMRGPRDRYRAHEYLEYSLNADRTGKRSYIWAIDGETITVRSPTAPAPFQWSELPALQADISYGFTVDIIPVRRSNKIKPTETKRGRDWKRKRYLTDRLAILDWLIERMNGFQVDLDTCHVKPKFLGVPQKFDTELYYRITGTLKVDDVEAATRTYLNGFGGSKFIGTSLIHLR